MRDLQIIKEIAWQRNVSIKNLAEMVGLSENGLHRLIRDNNTKMDTIEKIAKSLDAPLEYFYDSESVRGSKDGKIELDFNKDLLINQMKDHIDTLAGIIVNTEDKVAEKAEEIKELTSQLENLKSDLSILFETLYITQSSDMEKNQYDSNTLIEITQNRKKLSKSYQDSLKWDFVIKVLNDHVSKFNQK